MASDSAILVELRILSFVADKVDDIMDKLLRDSLSQGTIRPRPFKIRSGLSGVEINAHEIFARTIIRRHTDDNIVQTILRQRASRALTNLSRMSSAARKVLPRCECPGCQAMRGMQAFQNVTHTVLPPELQGGIEEMSHSRPLRLGLPAARPVRIAILGGWGRIQPGPPRFRTYGCVR